MSQIDVENTENFKMFLSVLEREGYYLVKQNLSVLDHCKLTYFLSVMHKYSIDEIEKRIPENPF